MVKASPDWRRSIIEVIDISSPDGRLAQRGQVTLAGQVPDKFKIHLTGDVLTVVSAVPRNWSGDWNARENLPRTMVESFSLADPEAPETLGSLELGVGESLFATRFSGDRLYVVTFLTIDPLYVVDLSDPGNPTLLGELEIPGFSTYIEPLGDRLVSIGRLDSRTAVSLFDVSDPAAPALISQLPLGEGYNHSEANWDEKAFGVFPEDGLILVPYSGYDSATGWASRIQLIDLHRDGLAKRGIVNQGFAARRTAIVDDRILAVSPSDLITVDFSDRDRPVVTSDVEIAWRVDRIFLSGDHLVQIGGSADWSRTSPPNITITSAADPDATLNLLELENVPVTGATVRNGKLYLAQQVSNGWLPLYRTTDGANRRARRIPSSSPSTTSPTLPAITRIGRTEADVDPGYGYGAGQLEPAWPDDGTLVWVREQWSSWWWYDRVVMPGPVAGRRVLAADSNVAVSPHPAVTLGPSGGMALTNLNLEAPPCEGGAGPRTNRDRRCRTRRGREFDPVDPSLVSHQRRTRNGRLRRERCRLSEIHHHGRCPHRKHGRLERPRRLWRKTLPELDGLRRWLRFRRQEGLAALPPFHEDGRFLEGGSSRSRRRSQYSGASAFGYRWRDDAPDDRLWF